MESTAAEGARNLQPGLARRVVRDGALSMIALIVLGGARILYGALISHATDHATYGTVGVLNAVTLLASFVLPAGLGAAMTRFVPFSRGQAEPGLARAFFRYLARSSEIAALGLAGLAALATALLLHGAAMEVVEVAALTALYSLYTTDKAALYGFGRVRAYVGLEIAGSTLSVLATVAVVAAGSTWYLLPFILGYGLFVGGARLVLRSSTRGERPALTRAQRRELAIYVGLACAGTLASAGFLQGTQLLSAAFPTPTAVAYFAAAVTLVAPLYFLPRALALALFPFMAEAHGAGEPEVVRRHLDISTRALLVLLAPAFVIGELIAPEVLTVFGGPTYAAGAPVLQILLTAVFVGVIQVPSVNALSTGAGWQIRTPVAWAVTGCAVGLAYVALISGRAGGEGIALAYLLGTVITATGPIVKAWRRYRLAWTWPLARAVAVVATAAVVARAMGVPGTLTMGDAAVHVGAALAGLVVAVAVLSPDIRSILVWMRRAPGTSPAEGAPGGPVGALRAEPPRHDGAT